MSSWMTDAELAEAEEASAEDEGQRVRELTREIKVLETKPYLTPLEEQALEIKIKLRRACRQSQAQHKKNAAALRMEKPPVECHGKSHTAAPMRKW